jgi:hypothetical protein
METAHGYCGIAINEIAQRRLDVALQFKENKPSASRCEMASMQGIAGYS